jgi:hypothetical protein
MDLLLGESPKIECPKVFDLPDEEIFIDVSRYGMGLFEITQDGILAANPENVYMVIQPGNMRKVTAYVFFHEFEVRKTQAELNFTNNDTEKTTKYVKFTIYEPGSIRHQVYQIKGDVLEAQQNLANFPAFAGLIVDPEGYQYPFGIDGTTGKPPVDSPMLIIRVDNSLSSDRYYGRSDYTPAVFSLIEGLERAFAWRAEVLAKFARPIPNVPPSAMTFNHARQKWEFKTDEAMIIEEGEHPASYLVWEPRLAEVEVEINGMTKQLMMKLKLSDMLLAGETGMGAGAQSGTALGIRLIPTTTKVQKFASSYKTSVPQVLSLKSKLDESLGQAEVPAFEPDEVKIFMFDGIPNIPAEEATTRAANATALIAMLTANVLDVKTTMRQSLLLGVITKEALLPLQDTEAEAALDNFEKSLIATIKAKEAQKVEAAARLAQLQNQNLSAEALARGGGGLPA